jgi:Rv0078B-related antitoxin
VSPARRLTRWITASSSPCLPEPPRLPLQLTLSRGVMGRLGKLAFIDLSYDGIMRAMGGFRTLFAHLAERRGVARRDSFGWTPEAERMRSALEMHDLGVQLYRQRMRREHPESSRAEIDALVRGWLTAPPPDGRLRLPSREQGHDHTR